MMTRILSAPLFALALSFTASSLDDLNPPKLPASIIDAMDDQLVKNESRFGIAAQSVLILKNGQPIYEGRQGYANLALSVPIAENHIFPVYSISKLFTNVLLMKLVEDGKLEMEHSIRHYLPDLPETWDHVTVSHVWNHTSGLPEFFTLEALASSKYEDRSLIFQEVSDKPFQYETGTQTRYNQTGFMVLTAILEKLYGKSHPELVQEMIINRLELQETGHAGSRVVTEGLVTAYSPMNGELLTNQDLNWQPYTYSISALNSSKRDLVTFMEAVASGGFASKQTLKALWQPMKRTDGTPGSFANGWNYGKSGPYQYVGHTGGNSSKLRHYFTGSEQGDSYTIAYLSNGSRANIYIDFLVDGLMSHLDADAFALEAFGARLFDIISNELSDEDLNAAYEAILTARPDLKGALNGYINERAYNILSVAGPVRALPIFELNVRIYPKNANSMDSLAEAWLIAGNKDKAKHYYRKALELDPHLASAIQALEQLQ